MAGLPASLRPCRKSRRRRRLLHLGASDRRHRHPVVRHQSDRHHREDARAWHDHDEDADLHLDRALHEHPYRRRFSDPHGRSRAALPRSLRGHALLLERPRRQPDDVREPHLDLGSSGGLHPHPARFRSVFGDRLDLLRQAALRLRLDGLRHRGHHDPVLPRLAAPLLHDGLGCLRELVLRHHDDDHLDPDGGEALPTGSSPCTRAASVSRSRCSGPSASW